VADLQQALESKESEPKSVKASFEEKGKKVKFEEDTKILGYEN
jgi:hypothetical protein